MIGAPVLRSKMNSILLLETMEVVKLMTSRNYQSGSLMFSRIDEIKSRWHGPGLISGAGFWYDMTLTAKQLKISV